MRLRKIQKNAELRKKVIKQVDNTVVKYYSNTILLTTHNTFMTMLSISKVTTKCQTTIPKEVRDKLNISAGDYVEFDLEEDRVVLKKAGKIDKNFLKLTEEGLEEWNSKEDDRQFDYLKDWVK